MARPQHLKFFADFIERDLGIMYSEANDFQLERRLDEIAKTRGLTNSIDLYQKASERFDLSLMRIVRDAATNNETYFFRDQRVFDVVKTDVLPALFERARAEHRRVRIWSMACSYGQEPYSVAMMCRELIDAKGSAWAEAEIFATDIATHALEKAGKAIYSRPEVDRGLTPAQIDRYLRPEGDAFAITREVRSMVRFQTVNLLTDGFVSLGKFDLILCRNVLIYQNVQNKTDIVRKITPTLHPGGQLLLGAGESLIGLATEFRPTTVSGAVLFTRDPKTVAARVA